MCREGRSGRCRESGDAVHRGAARDGVEVNPELAALRSHGEVLPGWRTGGAGARVRAAGKKTGHGSSGQAQV